MIPEFRDATYNAIQILAIYVNLNPVGVKMVNNFCISSPIDHQRSPETKIYRAEN